MESRRFDGRGQRSAEHGIGKAMMCVDVRGFGFELIRDAL